MNELHLILSMPAIEALVQGTDLVLDVEDTEGRPLRVVLAADEATRQSFKAQVEKALLHMLPVGAQVH